MVTTVQGPLDAVESDRGGAMRAMELAHAMALDGTRKQLVGARAAYVAQSTAMDASMAALRDALATMTVDRDKWQRQSGADHSSMGAASSALTRVQGKLRRAEAERDRLLEAAKVTVGKLVYVSEHFSSTDIADAIAVLRAAMRTAPAAPGMEPTDADIERCAEIGRLAWLWGVPSAERVRTRLNCGDCGACGKFAVPPRAACPRCGFCADRSIGYGESITATIAYAQSRAGE